VRAAVMVLHSMVGLDANDARTTGFGEYSTTPLTTHEDAAPNGVQLLLFLAAAVVLMWRGQKRQRRLWLAVSAGFILYAVAFKWQPWGNRLHTPFFVLAAAPTAFALQLAVFGRLQKFIAVALLALSGPWLIANDTRSVVPSALIPWMLRATDIWTKPRIEQYFAGVPENYPRFSTLDERLRASGCTDVGVLADEASWTYALYVFPKQNTPVPTFRSVLVENSTAALVRLGPEPCALVLLAFGRMRGPEHTALAHFHLAWQDAPLALYLPGAPTER